MNANRGGFFVVAFCLCLGISWVGLSAPTDASSSSEFFASVERLQSASVNKASANKASIYDTQAKAFIPVNTWFERARHVQYLLVGEVHNRAAHTKYFLNIVAHMASNSDSGPDSSPDSSPASGSVSIPVVFEMLAADPTGKQSLVTGWEPAIYNPFFSKLAQHAQLIPGALTREQRNWLFAQSALFSPGMAKPAPMFATLTGVSENVYLAIIQDIIERHGSHPVNEQLARRMTNVQLGKDAKMAYLLKQASTHNTQVTPSYPSLLYAGLYHVRKDKGVPLHLPNASTMVVVLQNSNSAKGLVGEQQQHSVEPPQHSVGPPQRSVYTHKQADYVWYVD